MTFLLKSDFDFKFFFSLINTVGSRATQVFVSAFQVLFEKDVDTYKESEINSAYKKFVPGGFKTVLSLLNKSKDKAAHNLENLADLLFSKDEQTKLKPSPILKAFEKNKVDITKFILILRTTGKDSVELFEKLFNLLFEKKSQEYVKSKAFYLLEKKEGSFDEIVEKYKTQPTKALNRIEQDLNALGFVKQKEYCNKKIQKEGALDVTLTHYNDEPYEAEALNPLLTDGKDVDT